MGFLRDIGAPGVIVLVLAALLIFGPKRLPELGESIGKMFTSFKKSISGLTDDESSSDKNENEKENDVIVSVVANHFSNTSSKNSINDRSPRLANGVMAQTRFRLRATC